jgi:hypothetical protein
LSVQASSLKLCLHANLLASISTHVPLNIATQ